MTKIAIIEDDIAISQMYRMKFEMEGYTVQTAENGKYGVALCKEMRPDVILLDIRMPLMNGDEALQQIRSTSWGKNIPVFILTNVGEEEAPASLQKLNVYSYIVKAELTPSQVFARVKKLVDNKAPK